MSRGSKLLYGTLMLTGVSVLMRIIGLLFQVYLSNRIGSSGIGLFQLIGAVSIFAQTVAISGIRFTTTRLVSEELGRGNTENIRPVVKKCLIYAFFTGTLSSIGLFTFSRYIGVALIGDGRTVLSLKILAFSLPWMAMGTVFSGYFTAVSRVMKSAAVSIFEQIIRIITVVFALSRLKSDSLELICASVIFGGIVGETLSFVLGLIIWLFDCRRYGSRKAHSPKGIGKRILKTSVPIAVSAYARTALVSLENILIPKGLRASGTSADAALSGYGKVNGMVFPVITFPSSFFTSVSELIVPELTKSQVAGKNKTVSSTVTKMLRLCLIFSLGVTAVMVEYSGELSMCIYKSNEVANLIKICAVLMPVMYMDTVTDGMLRGLNQHMWSMWFNISDSVLCLLLIFLLLPKYGLRGYIMMIFISEIYNFSLSIGRLIAVSKPDIKKLNVFFDIAAAIGAGQLSRCAVNILSVNTSSVFTLSLCAIFCIGIYLIMLWLFGAVSRSDIDYLRSVLKRGKNK